MTGWRGAVAGLCEYPGLSFQRSPVCACSLVSSLLLSGATMSQQSSLTQSAHSVRQVLTAYTGEDKLKALLQESLAVATRTEAMKPSDLARVVIDTTVQPKAVMFPTDAKLLNRARERLVRLTKKLGVSLRQSYARVGKLALIKHQRYAHAHQFKRANRSLRKLKTDLGRVIRDIERRIVWNEDLQKAFVPPLFLARRVLEQERRQRGRKVYSLHAPEVECIGKGK